MVPFDKKRLSERDICTKFITPAIEEAGWHRDTHFLEEYDITKGRVIVRGQSWGRAKRKRVDYALFYRPNIPVAVIEAKDNKHTVGHGMQQALEYAEMMQVPFVFSSNGDGFLFRDNTGGGETTETELPLSEFPSPSELWRRYCLWKGIENEEEKIVAQDFYDSGTDKRPRYYQLNAINRTIEAISKGQDRILLVMATGTGKTFTAFQIIWRLWKSGAKKRILFLADRNILVDQTMTNDFKPFGNAMAKLSSRSKTIKSKDTIAAAVDSKTRTVDKSYEIYLSLYQAVSGNEDERNLYKQFSPDFFDLIVVDECHRGSAAENSQWREILDYFTSATQIGLTATPKETKEVSNIHYFGDPVYTYSLKQGIADGYLAPYKVVRIDIDKDLQGWRPTKGQLDKYGNPITDRVYNQKDFDRNLVLENRTELVAQKITQFLQDSDPYAKSIVFCENIDHAERMRQELVNANPALVEESRKYVMRITGDDQEGKAELDNFIMPEERYPVIATTSKLMTTGVDAQTCKLIVLDRTINSMTEFKQIIGRGTRIREEYGKTYFTIMDFRKATELFADPDFDGEPVCIFEPGPDDSPVPPDDLESPEPGEDGEDFEPVEGPIVDGKWLPDDAEQRPNRYYVKDVQVEVIAERVQYYDQNGQLITETLKDYTRKNVQQEYATLDDFLRRWNESDKKQAIIDELEEQGVLFDALKGEVGKDYGAFDLICHVAFDQPPLTRRERAENVKKRNYFTKCGEQARAVLSALLDKYADEGLDDLEDMNVLRVQPFTEFGTPVEIVKAFGGKKQYLDALRELEKQLFDTGVA